MKYKLITKSEIEKYLLLSELYDVSIIARKKGFLYNYMKYGDKILNKESDQKNLTWGQKRDLFIDRNLSNYKKKPTLRRYLSFICWGYKI